MRPLPVALATLALCGLAAAPAPAAQIWTEYPSGTTDEITAIDYVDAANVWYGTATGKILRNGVATPTFDDPSVGAITDIAASSDGLSGLATTANGRIVRTGNGGVTWAALGAATVRSYAFTSCDSAGPFPLVNVTGELTAIDWASSSVAYVVGANPAMVLRTTTAGVSWTEANKRADGTCAMGRLNSATPRYTDVDALGVGDAWFVKQGFGERQHTTDDFATGIPFLESSSNSGEARTSIAFDPAGPNRSFAASGHAGSLAFQASTDSGASYAPPQYLAGEASSITALRDVEVRDGAAVAVGAGGTILVAPGPTQAFFQPASGVATDWNAVDKLDAGRAVAGGSGGRIVISSQASTTTDVVPPTGTISGPATAVAGVAQTYTANVTDDRGVVPSSFQWRGDGPAPTGVAAADGNPAGVVFSLTGLRTLRVTFRDAEGNAGTATKQVLVSAAPSAGTPPGTTVIPPGTRNPRPTTTVTVAGGSVTLSGPRTCIRPGGSFTATLSFRKQRRKGSKFVKVSRVDFYIGRKRVKIDRKAPFRQKLTVRSLKAGTKHTLKARATIRVRRGKSPKKSISTSFSVCSS